MKVRYDFLLPSRMESFMVACQGMASKKSFELFEETALGGRAKCASGPLTAMGLTFLAGAYIALGGFLAVRAGAFFPSDLWGNAGKLAFASVFPLGLMLVVVCGADLFTGNCMLLASACSCRRISLVQGVWCGAVSWCGNFVGALFVAWFMAYATGLIFDTAVVGQAKTMPYAESVVNLANAKCHLGFAEAFWRGVGCNWLVCLAVYAALAAEDVMGKIVALWFPTMAFVALGMEHCIANMFFIPLGIWTGTDERYLAYVGSGKSPALTASWDAFFAGNLLPVTLGNIVGGAVLVSGVYLMAYRKNLSGRKG